MVTVHGNAAAWLRLPMIVIAVGLVSLGLSSSAAAAGCPNEAFRTGLSAILPDCRAYELVSPPDTDGRLPAAISSSNFFASRNFFPTELLSPSGESLSYMTYSSPVREVADPTGFFDVYRADRLSHGWQTSRRLTPSGEQSITTYPGGVSADGEYAFMAPLGYATIRNQPAGSLAEKGESEYLSKPEGSFELTGEGSLGSEPYAQGRYISEGGDHVIFTTGLLEEQSFWCVAAVAECEARQLDPDAPPTGTGAVYDRPADGLAHVVSLLPPNVPQVAGQQAFYKGSSKDASSIAFTIEGTLYVRIHNGEAGEETVKAAEADPVYAGFSDDGHYLFYVAGGEEGTIHRFDTESKADVAINPTAAGEVVNISANGTHVYFISKEQISGQGSPGNPNLFVWSGGSLTFIRTVASSDLERTSGNQLKRPALTRWTSFAVASNSSAGLKGPGADSSRTTPDGNVLVFESKAKLTAYENAGHTEIYRWDDVDKELTCVSCNQLKSSAEHDAQLQDLRLAEAPIVIHNLSDDGSRVFFETEEALVGRDTDEVNDIYEWHELEGGGESVELISSGESAIYLSFNGERVDFFHYPAPNALLSATPSGSDVVFLSQDALVAEAPGGGVPAIYDARVGGGFAEPRAPTICLEEGCRPSGSSTVPSLEGARSQNVTGARNVKPRKSHCRRGKRAKKHSCRKHKRGDRKKRNHRHGRARSSGALPSSAQPQSVESESTEASADPPTSMPVTNASAASSPTVSAAGEFEAFGIEKAAASSSTSDAGAHPDFTTLLTLNHSTDPETHQVVLSARAEDIAVALPPGLVGNPSAFPRCSTGSLIAMGNCPIASQVGIAKVVVPVFNHPLTEPVYNMEPPHPGKEVARLGFVAYQFPVFIDVHLRTAGDYGVTATVEDSPGAEALVEAETTLWGNPSDPSHDELRVIPTEAIVCNGSPCLAPEGKPREVPRTNQAFMTNPSSCQENQVDFEVTSYQLPGQVFTAKRPFAPTTECTGLPFEPSFSAEPTSHVAGAPTGLSTKLVLPSHEGADERATATMREARVTLPAGMQIAAGAANWIGTCSDAQVGFHKEVDAQCPNASKLGTVTITSPAISTPIEGSVYQRTPSPGHQFGLWLVSDALGLHVKIPGELEPDAATGRLTAVFSDLPQVPTSEIDLNIWGGARAPLQNPDHCGTFATNFSFAPHSADPMVSGQSQMQVTEGCNQGFNPSLGAGVTDPTAAHYSPLIFDLSRPDGDQALRGFELELPDGELAKLKGVPLCPDPAAASGSCPSDSVLGHVVAATGTGPEPLWVPQPGKPEPRVYLAGRYNGSPFSVVTEVPAQAGPFDLGTVVVRSGLGLNPDTNRAVVKADPLPQFFEGVGLSYRKLHVVIDRPKFSLNPTDCREMQVDSTVTSTLGTVTHPTTRFQVDGCRRLKFKPKLKIKLNGGTERAAYPALTAILKARRGDANIAKASVALPHSEFLAQEHIATICTRKQFAADKCPNGSVYGKAKAWTPLLAKPLEGPVYLRSSNHPLPDMVAALGGELDVNPVGRIDSDRAGGIRTTFDAVPDAPVTRFVIKMRGGKKSLLTNSTDICAGKHRATVRIGAQNGRRLVAQPMLEAKGCNGRNH